MSSHALILNLDYYIRAFTHPALARVPLPGGEFNLSTISLSTIHLLIQIANINHGTVEVVIELIDFD
jgi:hypothetical protein